MKKGLNPGTDPDILKGEGGCINKKMIDYQPKIKSNIYKKINRFPTGMKKAPAPLALP